MERRAIVFEAGRNGYSIGQIADGAMTVAELRGLLEDYDDDDLFVLSCDNGYTYGSIESYKCYEAVEDEDGEWGKY